MSWLAWIVAAAFLCPTWWRVAQEADRLQKAGRQDMGRLAGLLHKAALYTALVIAAFAVVAVIVAVGAHPAGGLDVTFS